MTITSSNAVFPLEIQSEETELKLRSLTIKRWLRTDEVALYLGTSRGAIKNMVHRGNLHPKKYCGRNYFDRGEIDRLIDSSNNKRRIQWR